MPAKKKNPEQTPEENEFVQLGGELRWSGKGAHLFIPAEFIGWWPQVVLEVSEDRKTIALRCIAAPKGKKK